MANYKGHLVGGAIVTGAFTALISFAPVEKFAEYAHILQDWQALTAVFVIGMLFALFPDVDTNSKGQDIFYWILFPVDVLLIYSGHLQAAAYLGLVGMLPVLTHSPRLDTYQVGDDIDSAANRSSAVFVQRQSISVQFGALRRCGGGIL